MTLPQQFIDMLRSIGGDVATVADTLPTATVSPAIRINAAKGMTPPTGATPVAWCEGGYYLAERPAFTLDPALHQGLYYVQDASSMAHAAAVARAAELRPADTLRYLDACAAPGGKTIAAVDVLPSNAFIVANEPDPHRAAVLRENVAKHGSGRVAVTRADASTMKLREGFFDIIAADVPCSGEGMMAKEDVAVAQWSPSLVTRCADLQRRIIDNLWPALAPGGLLIYSTCTFNLDENERMVDYIATELGAEVMDIPALDRPEISHAAAGYNFPAYRFLPGRVDGHGQFIALLRKNGDEAHARVKTVKPSKAPADASRWLDGDWTVIGSPDALRAVRTAHIPLVEAMAPVSMAGVELGVVKGRDFIPSQALALSADLRPDAFAMVEVDRPTALEYLRRNAVTLPDGAPTDVVLLTHIGRPLGFVKNLGRRTNNLYPAAWRILK